MNARVEELPTRVLRNAELILPDRCLEGDLLLRRTEIVALAPAGHGKGEEIWDLAGRRVAPGLIDLHCHGGWGVDFYRDPVDRIAGVAQRFAAAGVTHLLLTLHPGPPEELLDRISAAVRACRASPIFLGIHLEGPFLARDRRGALPEAGILPYDDALMGRIIEIADKSLRVMTFAPEAIPTDAVRRILSAGIHLSVGHTSADAAAVEGAIRAGVNRATHLCNAMPAMHHRHPGPVVPLLLDRRVRVEVIADGQHLDDRFLRMILSLKGEDGVMAVSDAMPLAGLGACQGDFAGAAVSSDGVRATRADGTLAGSVTLLPAAFDRLERVLDIPPHRIWRLGATAPAADLRLPRVGRVASGYRADLIIFGGDGDVEATLFAGERIGASEGESFLPEEFARIR